MRGGTPPDILSRRFRGVNVQASRRVGFGTWALAVQLRPKPLARRRRTRNDGYRCKMAHRMERSDEL
jgi:hypothetical protein